MWWVPLAAMAANMLSKREAEKKAEKLSLASTLNDIAHTRAQRLGAQPYSAMVDNMVIGDAARKAQSHNAGDSIGMALQAYSALDKGFGGGAGSSTPEQPGVDAGKYSLLSDEWKGDEPSAPRSSDPFGGTQLQEDDYGLLSGRGSDLYRRFRL